MHVPGIRPDVGLCETYAVRGLRTECVMRERALRAFVRDGRLIGIPARRSRRLIILGRLAQDFEPGVHYTEAEVNRRLLRWHPDVAALRRYLVEEGFLDRSRSGDDYWRAGGSFDCD